MQKESRNKWKDKQKELHMKHERYVREVGIRRN